MQIAQIKSQLSIHTVIDHYGLSTDRNQRICCPWHPDKTPSLQIYPKTNTWTCFSSNCSAGSGDQIEMIQRMESSTKHEALQKAKKMLGVSIIKAAENKTQPDFDKIFLQLKEAFENSRLAQDYAQSRGLIDVELAYSSGNVWRSMRSCLIFPLKNQQGKIVSFYGRNTKAQKGKSYRHYYSAGRQGLYPAYPDPEIRKLILTECIIDAASLDQLGFDVLALYGSTNLNDEHLVALDAMKRLEEIVLFFDGDAAGRQAANQYQELLLARYSQIRIQIIQTDDGEDVNSLLVKYGAEYLEQKLVPSTSTKTEKEENHLDTSISDLLRYHHKITCDSDMEIQILGGIKINGLDRMRVTLKLSNNSFKMPLRHSLDLYHHKQLDEWIERVADHFELHRQEIHQCFGHLITALEEYRMSKIESLKPQEKELESLTIEQEKQAIEYLKQNNLIKQSLKDIMRSGIVGEQYNALIAYLAYTSRKREKPMHIMFLGSSGSGKTHLQEQLSKFIPDSEKIEITSLSDNALYYFKRTELKNKLICIEDLDGAENALYPLRELQSKRQISKTVPIKDSKGQIKTVHLVVEGPVCVSGCTTRERIYEDNANRCILLHIDQSRAQSKRIMELQKRQSAGLVDQDLQEKNIQLLQWVQCVLKPVQVVNPYAMYIDIPSEVFKPRRSLLLLLNFIETISFYHQYQRKVKLKNGQRYIESTVEDIELAFRLMKDILFTKSDELNKACRIFFEQLKIQVKEGQSFYSRELRTSLRISPSTMKRQMSELTRYGRLRVIGGSKYRGYEYEIVSYEEYNQLKGSIDEKLQAILVKIKEIKKPSSGSVAKQWPNGTSEPVKQQKVNGLKPVAQ